MRGREQIAEGVRRYRSYGYPVISALLLGLSACVYRFGWVVIVAMIPLVEYWYVFRLSQKHLLLGSVGTGMLYFAILLSWTVTSRVHWANVTPFYKSIIIGFAFVTTILVLSIGFALSARCIRRLNAFRSPATLLLTLPAAWVLGEYIASWAFSILQWSPGQSTIGSEFALGHLGMALATTPLGYAARLVGLYGLSFAAVVINLSLWYSLKRRRMTRSLVVTVVTIGCITLLGRLLQPSLMTPLTVGAEHLSRSGQSSDHNLTTPLAPPPSRQLGGLDLLVLPEYAPPHLKKPLSISEHTSSLPVTSRVLQPRGMLVYDTASATTAHQRNDIVLATPQGRTLNRQAKSYLLPVGEYIPSAYRFSLKVLGLDRYVRAYGGSDYLLQKGPRSTPYSHRGITYGSLACAAVTAPRLYQQLAKEDANILTNSASVPFTSDHSAIHGELREEAHFTAVANAKPLVVSSRAAASLIFDHNGNTLAKSTGAAEGVITAKVHPTSGRTLYSLAGEYILPMSLAVIAWILGAEFLARHK